MRQEAIDGSKKATKDFTLIILIQRLVREYKKKKERVQIRYREDEGGEEKGEEGGNDGANEASDHVSVEGRRWGQAEEESGGVQNPNVEKGHTHGSYE